jgi:putative membrane protein
MPRPDGAFVASVALPTWTARETSAQSAVHQEMTMLLGLPRKTPGRTAGMLLIALTLAMLVASGIHPVDRLTWAMEVIWVAVGLPLIVLAWPRFPLTRLLCILLVIHAAILIYGGHYTYAKTPLGDWFREWLELSRNHYDRLGHFAQGFVPAILARELLLRRTALRPGAWLFYLCTSCALAFSAFFEMIEWWAALTMGGRADDYLATQGDIWDTQWDMFLAMCGAMLSQLLFSRQHDRELGPSR